MNNQFIKFIKTNLTLYIILLINILIEYNNSIVIQKLNTDKIYYYKIFDSLILNFIYLLLPFYNIGIKIAKDSNNIIINFTNMIKLQVICSSILSILCFYSKSYYYNKMKIEGSDYSIHVIVFTVTINSLLGCLNGYLTGKNDNRNLLKFNIIYLISSYFSKKIILNYHLYDENLIYTRNFPAFLCCIYILYCYKSFFCYKYFLSSKIKFIKIGFLLMLRSFITLFSININNYILFKLNKVEIKRYELFSSKISNYINIYSPLSPIIQKKIYDINKINTICVYYSVFSIILLNLINYYYWHFNFIIINLYNILHFIVFINESKNITYNRINKSIFILLCIIVCKYIIHKFINITLFYEYYYFINTSLFLKSCLNYLT